MEGVFWVGLGEGRKRTSIVWTIVEPPWAWLLFPSFPSFAGGGVALLFLVFSTKYSGVCSEPGQGLHNLNLIHPWGCLGYAPPVWDALSLVLLSASPSLLEYCLCSQGAWMHHWALWCSNCGGGVRLPNISYLFVNLWLALEDDFWYSHPCMCILIFIFGEFKCLPWAHAFEHLVSSWCCCCVDWQLVVLLCG